MENFASSYDSVLQAAIPKDNVQLIQIKLELARHFIVLIRCLLRHCRMFHSLQNQLANCNGLIKQLYQDWTRIDVEHFCDKIIQLYHRTGTTINHHFGISQNLTNSNVLYERLHMILYKCKNLFLKNYSKILILFSIRFIQI